MTVEREAPSETLATPIARDGRNGIAPLNGAQPSNDNYHHISEHVSERVAELVDQLTLEAPVRSAAGQIPSHCSRRRRTGCSSKPTLTGPSPATWPTTTDALEPNSSMGITSKPFDACPRGLLIGSVLTLHTVLLYPSPRNCSSRMCASKWAV
jgi:hypothetical protein